MLPASFLSDEENNNPLVLLLLHSSLLQSWDACCIYAVACIVFCGAKSYGQWRNRCTRVNPCGSPELALSCCALVFGPPKNGTA